MGKPRSGFKRCQVHISSVYPKDESLAVKWPLGDVAEEGQRRAAGESAEKYSGSSQITVRAQEREGEKGEQETK